MIDQILVIAGLTFLVMISPGPDMIIVLRNTVVGGRVAGLQTSLGVLTGNLVHITYCVAGIGWLISKSILAFSLLKYAGATYLIFLGIMSLRGNRTSLNTGAVTYRSFERTWFWQGFVNNILNPKGTLFYLGVFTMVITPETSPAAALVLVLTMIMISASFWLFFVTTLNTLVIRSLLERSQQIISRVFGVVLISLGIRVATMER